MDLSLFDYDLPVAFIAQEPVPERAESKLMVLSGNGIEHRQFSDLIEYLTPDDTLVLNNTRVLPARLRGQKTTGGKAEILLLKRYGNCEEEWECLLRAKRLQAGAVIELPSAHSPEAKAQIIQKFGDGRFLVRFEHHCVSFADFLAGAGEMPTPPYIKRRLEDPERYQTVYASENGSVAAPTAGLHFTPGLIEVIAHRGIETVEITLHVGLGTFQPVRAQRVEEHRMEPEYYHIDRSNREKLERAYAEHRRIIAVGTTVLKTLESACVKDTGVVRTEGWSELFIYPGYGFRAGVELLVTNFHLPKSTLIMLVAAFAGRERILDAYEIAKQHGYRFYSFGDAMLAPFDPD